ncbi:hypothetical protein ACFY7C_29500 [Streptomyces sp. NPDC012769]|uniref:hypothetical protein n=1 Tax=Streptomyces sp. NPDC012769 TaxID=3364848 RepID=UPI0036AEE470
MTSSAPHRPALPGEVRIVREPLARLRRPALRAEGSSARGPLAAQPAGSGVRLLVAAAPRAGGGLRSGVAPAAADRATGSRGSGAHVVRPAAGPALPVPEVRA